MRNPERQLRINQPLRPPHMRATRELGAVVPNLLRPRVRYLPSCGWCTGSKSVLLLLRAICAVGSVAIGVVGVYCAPAEAAIGEIRASEPHVDTYYTVAHPYYGTPSTSVDNTLSEDASSLGGSIDTNAKDATEQDANQRADNAAVRTCAKAGLFDMAFDIAWIIENGISFNFEEQAKDLIQKCLEAANGTGDSIGEPSAVAATLARTLGAGAENALRAENDLYGLADWLYAVDYYYVSEAEEE